MKRAAILLGLCTSVVCCNALALLCLGETWWIRPLDDALTSENLALASAAVFILLDLTVLAIMARKTFFRRPATAPEESPRRIPWLHAVWGVRTGSIVIAIIWCLICWGAGAFTIKLRRMFEEMNIGAVPWITSVVISLDPFEWAMICILGLALIFKKDEILAARDGSIANAVLGMAILAMFATLVFAFLAPLTYCPIRGI